MTLADVPKATARLQEPMISKQRLPSILDILKPNTDHKKLSFNKWQQ